MPGLNVPQEDEIPGYYHHRRKYIASVAAAALVGGVIAATPAQAAPIKGKGKTQIVRPHPGQIDNNKHHLV